MYWDSVGEVLSQGASVLGRVGMYLARVQLYLGEWECTWPGCKCTGENGDVPGLGASVLGSGNVPGLGASVIGRMGMYLAWFR